MKQMLATHRPDPNLLNPDVPDVYMHLSLDRVGTVRMERHLSCVYEGVPQTKGETEHVWFAKRLGAKTQHLANGKTPGTAALHHLELPVPSPPRGSACH